MILVGGNEKPVDLANKLFARHHAIASSVMSVVSVVAHNDGKMGTEAFCTLYRQPKRVLWAKGNR